MALFIYGVAANTGKGFFTAEDRRNFFQEVTLEKMAMTMLMFGLLELMKEEHVG